MIYILMPMFCDFLFVLVIVKATQLHLRKQHPVINRVLYLLNVCEKLLGGCCWMLDRVSVDNIVLVAGRQRTWRYEIILCCAVCSADRGSEGVTTLSSPLPDLQAALPAVIVLSYTAFLRDLRHPFMHFYQIPSKFSHPPFVFSISLIPRNEHPTNTFFS